jgi:transcriptional regulator with XRE-family HTH domain
LTERQRPAELIRTFRKANNLGVKELAYKAKVHEQIIYRLQRNETKGVSARAREKVAAVLGCDPADLLPI